MINNLPRRLRQCAIGGRGDIGGSVYVNVILVCNMPNGAWWLSGRFGALSPEGRRFETHSSRQVRVRTLDKSFTYSCL